MRKRQPQRRLIMDYREMSIKLLQSENPQELKRLQSEGLMEEVMAEVERTGLEIEQEMISQMENDLPPNTPYLQKVQAMNNARLVAQEVAAQTITEFWRGDTGSTTA
jgi:hypothetical protein